MSNKGGISNKQAKFYPINELVCFKLDMQMSFKIKKKNLRMFLKKCVTQKVQILISE